MSPIDPDLAGYLRAALTCEFPNVDGAVIGEVVDAVTAPVNDGKVASPVPARLAAAHDRARRRLWDLCSAPLPTASTARTGELSRPARAAAQLGQL